MPGYVLALFVPFSLLPFVLAAVIWYALLVAAVAATVELLRALTGLPRAALAAAVLGADVVSSVTYGQLSPLATLGIAAAALGLSRDRPRRAALACALVLLPTADRARTGRVAAALGRARAHRHDRRLRRARARRVRRARSRANVEYARSVVSAQALAEASFEIQLSLTWLLVFFGSGEPAALHVAWLEYAAMLVAGVLLARLLAARLHLPEMLVVVPAAAAVLGGTYLHVFQLAAALPCALVLAARVPAARVPAWIATALLAVPWQATGLRLVLAMSALALRRSRGRR